MKRIKIDGVDEKIIYEKMPNGLDVYLLPNKKVKNFYMTFNTKFGSLYTEFKKNNENTYTKIPNGVAHFLEHLKFKTANGDAMEYFADLGSSANAYTSFKVTCYEVYGFNHFKENLDYLLDFVQTPFFNKEMVEGEKGIITEEIKMYEDNPTTNLSFEMNRSLFHNDHRKYLVSGTVADVKKTTLKDIETAYNTFYHPSNMFVIITGNFNPEEALAIIEQNQSSKNFPVGKEIKLKNIAEPAKVVKELSEVKCNVEIPKVNIGLKIPLSSFKSLKLDEVELNIYLSSILNSNFGRTSELKERLTRGNVITDGIVIQRYNTDDYIVINFLAETPYPERYLSIMKEALKNITISEEELLRKKRVAISNFILSFDDIDTINTWIQSDIILYGDIRTNLFELYNVLDLNIAKKVADKISDKNMAVVILEPNDE